MKLPILVFILTIISCSDQDGEFLENPKDIIDNEIESEVEFALTEAGMENPQNENKMKSHDVEVKKKLSSSDTQDLFDRAIKFRQFI